VLERYLTLAATRPDAAALIDSATGEVTTRAALLDRAEEIAARFESAGLRDGDVVAVRLPNSVDFVAAFLAALKLRLVFAPIDRDAHDSEVAAIVERFGIAAVVGRADALVRPVAASSRDRSESSRLLKLTSGSSGASKAIFWTEAHVEADCQAICATMGIAPDDINLGAIPFSHSYGFSNLVTPLLMQGTAVVFSNDYLPHSLIELANRHCCTVAPLIPMVFDHLAALPSNDGRFESVRTFVSAGAPLEASTSRRFRERYGIPIHSFYGCSEVGGITYDREGAAAERGTVGAPLIGVSVGVDAAQRLTIRSGSFDGLFTADDLAAIDANGEVILTGRVGDLINTAGKKVNPREVEEVILQIDGVHQAKVYGKPAGARGEVVAAAIVADPGVTRELVREHCRARLSPHKVPRVVKMIERIPVDERGKVKRAALAQL
jgi:long-chain acyl-CoA synthetase